MDLPQDLIDEIKNRWVREIKDKPMWLYHGTSILFLPIIKECGLDITKFPKGIRRGITNISQILVKHGITRPGQFDIDVDITKKGTCLSYRPTVFESATVENLPAFMYELFNENAKDFRYVLSRIHDELSTEELNILKTAWRFGRILRKKNKVVLLKIRVDSEFLKCLGIPDYISDWNSFLKSYILPLAKGIPYNEPGRTIALDYSFEEYMPLRHIAHGSAEEIRFIKPIPPEFIYLDIKHFFGRSSINIKEWDETKEPILIKP